VHKIVNCYFARRAIELAINRTGLQQMSFVFAYCRVITVDQTTENQIREIEAAGFARQGSNQSNTFME